MKKLLISLMATVMLAFSGQVAIAQASSGAVATGEDTAQVVQVDNTDEVKEFREFKLSDDDKVFLGVCGGIGEYFGIDSDIVRLGFVILSLGFGVGLLSYVIAFIIMAN